MTVFRIGLTLALTLSALATGSCSGCSTASKAAPAVTADYGAPADAKTPPPPPVQGLSADPLENAFRAIEDGERDAARDRWDPAYVVARVGRDPDALASWVRGETTWIPYTGVLRGPVGVLLDRQGNALDRALLLAALLKEAGHTIRLARAELPAETARGLLAAILAERLAALTGRSDGASRPSSDADILAASERYRLDTSALQRSLAAQRDEELRLASALGTRVEDQTARLLAAIGAKLPDADWHTRYAASVAVLRDHWWVQRQSGARWIDMDISGAVAAGASALAAAATIEPDAVPEALRHLLVVRVIAEQSSGTDRSERTVLEHILRPGDIIGQSVSLRFAPTDAQAVLQKSADPSQFMAAARDQREWIVVLQVAREAVAKAVVAADGGAPKQAAGGGGLGGGLAGGIASILGGLDADATKKPDPAGTGELTAAWIEFDVRVPGQTSRPVRRPVFDLIGPSARAARPVRPVTLDADRKLTRSLALMTDTEVLPLVAWLPNEYLIHLYARSLLANRGVIRTIAAGRVTDPFSAAKESPFVPPPGSLHVLANARFGGPRGRHVYLDRPTVLTRHAAPISRQNRVYLRDVIDIVSNEVGVDLFEPNSFAARVEQGVIDTNAEALIRTTAAPAGNVANAYAVEPASWRAIDPAASGSVASLKLSDDSRRRIAADLSSGHLVVAPAAPVALTPEPFTGWWRIEQATGQTLGMTAEGWGGSQFGDLVRWASEHQMLLLAMTEAFAFSYYLCDRSAIECLPGAILNALFALGMNNGFGRSGPWRDLYRDTRGGTPVGGGGGGSGGSLGPGGTQRISGPSSPGGSGGGRPALPSGGGPALPASPPPGTRPLGPKLTSAETRAWAEAIPDHEVLQFIGGIKVLNGADNASSAAYHDAIGRGAGHDAAYAASEMAWMDYVRRMAPKTPGMGGKGRTLVMPPAPIPQPPADPCPASPCAQSVPGHLMGGILGVQELAGRPPKR